MSLRFAIPVALLAAAITAHAAVMTLNPTQDLRILSYFPGANDNNNGLATYTEPGNVQRTLIQFDYSSLAGMSISSATLRLHGVSYDHTTGPTTMDAYRIASPWSETHSSWTNRDTAQPWDNPGGDALGTTGAQLSDPYSHWTGNNTSAPAWFEIDVTSLVAGAVAGDFDNNGIMLSGGIANHLEFVSREGQSFGAAAGAATDVPELVVNAVAIPEPASASLFALSLLALRRRRSPRL